MDEWVSVGGVLVRGYRKASSVEGGYARGRGSIELQMPVFQKLGIDFTRCYPGTLNVSIAPKTFRMLASEPTLRGVKWIEEHRPEDFFLSQCRIKFRDHIYGGWVYYPDPRTKQKHFFPPSSMEIVAEHISGIQYGDEVMLEINPKEISIEPESAL